jgi:hypothetical protein
MTCTRTVFPVFSNKVGHFFDIKSTLEEAE